VSRNEEIDSVFNGLRDLVKEKNKRYGDSALSPVATFATDIRPGYAIRVRLDDKLARIRNSGQMRKNDIADIMGYLALICVSEHWLDFSDLLD